MTTIRPASGDADDPPVLRALYAALEASIEPPDSAFWTIGSDTPAQERAEKRAAMRAVYNLAVYHWFSGWRFEPPPAGGDAPGDGIAGLTRAHERLYTCGYESFAEAIKAVAADPAAAWPPDDRAFLMFLAGVCVCVQTEMMAAGAIF